jgi:metallo-beta-lactamase class B
VNRISTRSVLVCAVCAFAAAISSALPLPARAQSDPQSRSENQGVAPFHIVGNIYYVGASDVTSFLIVTSAGDILLDGGFVQTAPQIEANIRKLGFKLSDVKILLNSHAHFDHAGGLAELKRLTGARLVAMQGDAALLARGGRGDFYFGDRLTFPPIKPDRVIRDGDTVTLGNVTMTAHLTAGHTRGCTTWTTTAKENGKPLHVVFIGSMSVLSGYRLVGRESYPGMTADYERSFRLLRSLPCDVFLASHGQFFDLTRKREALAHAPRRNPFIDPEGYRAYLDRSEQAFQAEFRRQQAAAPSRDSSSSGPVSGGGDTIARTDYAKVCCATFALRKVSDTRDGTRPRQARTPPPGERTASAVMTVENDWLAALQHRDVKTLARILAEEFIDSDWQGDAIARNSYLSYFARPAGHPQPGISQHFEDTKVRFVANGDVAIVTGIVVSEPGGPSAAGSSRTISVHKSRFTDVFIWRDGRWQAVSGQETHFPTAK